MGFVLIIIAAALLTAALVYIRYMAKRHVAALFRTLVQEFLDEGLDIGQSMRNAVSKFTRRAPFSRIPEDDLSFLLDVLQDLNSPIETGAEILQRFDRQHRITDLQYRLEFVGLAHKTDLTLNLRRLIENAKKLQKKLNRRYPNITLALLASLSVRDGWTFIEEQKASLDFSYRGKAIRLSKRDSGKDAARLVLFEETARRPVIQKPDPGYEIRKSGRQEFVDNFDRYFDEAFHSMSN
jgi:hypothetical protein